MSWRIEFFKIKETLLRKLNIRPSGHQRAYGLTFNYNKFNSLVLLLDEIFEQKTWDTDFQTDSPFIIDCGGNIGVATMFFKKKYPKAKILIFEPDKENFKRLQENIKNNFSNYGIKLINAAVLDKEGSAQLYTSNCDLVASMKKRGLHESKERVRTVKLSNYVNQKIDLLKIDVEGCEYEIIKDLVKNDKLQFISKIAIEFHSWTNRDATEIIKPLEKNGFCCRTEKASFESCSIIRCSKKE